MVSSIVYYFLKSALINTAGFGLHKLLVQCAPHSRRMRFKVPFRDLVYNPLHIRLHDILVTKLVVLLNLSIKYVRIPVPNG